LPTAPACNVRELYCHSYNYPKWVVSVHCWKTPGTKLKLWGSLRKKGGRKTIKHGKIYTRIISSQWTSELKEEDLEKSMFIISKEKRKRQRAEENLE
jgi:hypothetical protein